MLSRPKSDDKVAEQLLEAGAKLFVTDINEVALRNIGNYASSTIGELTIVASDEIYGVEADIFVPCARGGIINDETLKQLQVKAVVGSANNQLFP